MINYFDKLKSIKNRSIYYIILLFLCLGCEKADKSETTALQNFEALWTIMDEHYCFFEYKDIDWDEVYNRYKAQVNDGLNQYELFDLMGSMLKEVKDGHVNLSSSFDVSRYWDWYEGYPKNFNAEVQENYLGDDYRIAGGMKYKLIADERVGYIYYSSFASSVSLANLSYIFHQFKDCEGLIIDIRNNGGGSLAYADRIASCYIDTKILTGYVQHKTGPAHDAFSDPNPIYLEPSGLFWARPVVVLTNRRCYSAANDFVCTMKNLPQVSIIGDKTGGGGGLPFSAELPNGWGVRFSASPMLDTNKKQIELGINPDIKVDMSNSDIIKGLDSIVEEGIKKIQKKDP